MAMVVGVSNIPEHLFEHDAVFQVGHVVHVLGLSNKVTYEAMRKIRVLVGHVDEDPASEGDWDRYGLEEFAGAQVAVALLRAQYGKVGDTVRIQPAKLEAACKKLKDNGYTYPLIQTRIAWDGRSFICYLDGFIVDLATGQSRIKELVDDLERQLEFEDTQRERLQTAQHLAQNRLSVSPTRTPFEHSHGYFETESEILTLTL